MNRRSWRALRYALGGLGLLGWVGLALLAAAGGYAVAIRPERQQVRAECLEDIGHWQRQRQALLTRESAAGGESAQRLAMPTPTEAPAALRTLRQAAMEAGLRLARSDHRYGEAEAAPVARRDSGERPAAPRREWQEVRISLPVAGGYGDLRAFLAQALEALPTLALDELVLRRDAIGNDTVQGQLRFILFVRPATP